MHEKVIQFGEGNFLRAFVDWIIWKMDQRTDFNGSVVIVQPLANGMVDWLNGRLPISCQFAGPRERQTGEYA